MIIRAHEPLNAGPAPEQLCAADTTPTSQFFVRTHGSVPTVDTQHYRLLVDGDVVHPLSLALSDIHALPVHTITATVQCAGQRRRELHELQPIINEIIWDLEAISTAVWQGARLADVLRMVGVSVPSDHAHVAFLGMDEIEKDREQIHFGASIPLSKALDPDTLLAHTMNGEPLMPLHGYPVRVLVPGYIGARSVKWLHHIRVQTSPSDNYYQQVAYKLQRTNSDMDGLMLGELPVSCAICTPQSGVVLRAGQVEVCGYALAGSRAVARVDVSADGGRTWRAAELLPDAGPWAWRRWQVHLEFAPGKHELIARAWDDAANTQPEQIETVWNPKGYMNNAWHRLQVIVME